MLNQLSSLEREDEILSEYSSFENYRLTFRFFRRTRHGYLNDDFIDDELEDQEDQEWEMTFNGDDETPKHKKRRGRPKKIKEEEIEELQHYDDEGER